MARCSIRRATRPRRWQRRGCRGAARRGSNMADLPETPALIIRFCLEHERESDPKYFLTVRNTEEAWHLECCHRFAETLGGYIAEPASPRYRELFNQGLHREALDASRHLDAYVAAHVGIQDGLDLELCRLHRDNAADPVARAILDRLVADKTRHAAFGWFYLENRAAAWNDTDRQHDRRRDRARRHRHRAGGVPLRLAGRRRCGRSGRGRPHHRRCWARRRRRRRRRNRSCTAISPRRRRSSPGSA